MKGKISILLTSSSIKQFSKQKHTINLDRNEAEDKEETILNGLKFRGQELQMHMTIDKKYKFKSHA